MRACNHNDRLSLIMIVTVLAFFLFVTGMGSAWAEHRVIDEYELSHKATSVTHAPNWYQYRIDNYHPIGCGPVAWTMLYAYWHSFKGKADLFDTTPPDATSGGYKDPEVTGTADEIGEVTETSRGQFGSQVFGRTWSRDMCKGIEYAKAKGYTQSRCLEITGTEADKFVHIKNYITSDKPVILNINAKGIGIYNHYVVVEGVRKRQEKVAGKWRDRDIEYLANFGWGERGGSRWISVRQKGINTDTVYSSGKAYLIDISGTPLPEAADANEAACKEWCNQNKPECAMCSRIAGCTPGYERIKSFKEAGKNWYACTKKDTKRSDASEQNRLDCEAWCEAHRTDKGCVKCDTLSTCGSGYIHLKTWRGKGNNWHACRKEGKSDRDKASEKNQQDCLAWCDTNKPECVECNKKLNCGIGLKTLKSFTGYGTNWHACGKNEYGIASEKNKTDCESWCRNNQPLCEECSANVGCGGGQTSMKTFKGEGGKNWYACRKADSQANKDACISWCNSNKPPCIECSTHVGCGQGRTSMKSFGGPGDNWFACRTASDQANKDACEIWCNQNKPTCVGCSTHVGCGRGKESMKSFKGPGDNWFACKRK